VRRGGGIGGTEGGVSGKVRKYISSTEKFKEDRHG
jgi:hypothetical protein